MQASRGNVISVPEGTMNRAVFAIATGRRGSRRACRWADLAAAAGWNHRRIPRRVSG